MRLAPRRDFVFAVGALDSYAAVPDDPDRLVPSPAKKAAAAQVRRAEILAAAAQAQRDASLAALRNPAPGQPVTITNQMINALDAPVQAAYRELEEADKAAAATPARVPLGTLALAFSDTPASFIRADAGMALLVCVLVMWFSPKIVSAIDILLRPELRRAFGGTGLFITNYVIETVYSILLCPILWFGHTLFLAGLLFGLAIYLQLKNLPTNVREVQALVGSTTFGNPRRPASTAWSRLRQLRIASCSPPGHTITSRPAASAPPTASREARSMRPRPVSPAAPPAARRASRTNRPTIA